MIKVDVVEKCGVCKGVAIIKKVYVEDGLEETYFVKEYICNCGNTTKKSEVIAYML